MIGIIGAMDIEVAQIAALMKETKECTIAGHSFVCGTIESKQVVLVKSGVGKVAASLATTLLIATYNPRIVLNIGTAGALLKQQQVLDIVIGSSCVQHDFDTSILDGEQGLGIVSPCAKSLLQVAQEVLEKQHRNVWIGQIATGDQFVYELDALKQITTTFKDAIACEMEASAVAFVCNKFEVPCLIIRSLSDNPFHPDSHFEFISYATKASKQSASFCKEFIQSLN